MPTFDLLTHSAKISTPIRAPLTEGVGRWRLGLTVTVPPGSKLTLATGEDVSSLEMVLAFSVASEEASPAAGAAHYFPGSIIFDCPVSREAMSELLRFARLGRFPSAVSIGTESDALTHDWRPDGSGLIWANDRVTVLPFSHMSFELPLSGAPPAQLPETQSTNWAQWTFWLLAGAVAAWIVRSF